MKKIITILTVCAFHFAMAQVGIGTSSPHAATLLDIKSPNKGVIFTHSPSHTQFPQYNASAFDLFNDDPSLKGALIFNKTDKQYYKYDGLAWNPARQVTAKENPLATRIKATGTTSILCLQGGLFNICMGGGDGIPMGTQAENPNEVLIDNLNIHTSEVSITQPGLYVVVASVGLSGQTLTCGIAENQYKANIEALYPGNSNWIGIGSKASYSGSFIFDLGPEKNTSASMTVFLPANSKIRVKPTINSPNISCGGLGATNSVTDPTLTYLGVQLIHKY